MNRSQNKSYLVTRTNTMSELKEMRTMINEKHGIAKILEEIIEYAETLGF